jgi:outer membrane protein assembly factor BamB
MPPSQPGSTFARSIPTRAARRTATRSFDNNSPITTPAFHDGRLIVSGGFNSREIYCSSRRRPGRVGRALSDDGPSAPVCEGNICAFNTESCTTFAVDAATGETKWAWWLGDPETAAPTIAHGRLFVLVSELDRRRTRRGDTSSPRSI